MSTRPKKTIFIKIKKLSQYSYKNGSTAKGNKPTLALKSLLPKMFDTSELNSSLSIPSTSMTIDNPNDYWGKGAGEFERIADTVKVTRVAEKVASLSKYPRALAYRRIGGNVK